MKIIFFALLHVIAYTESSEYANYFEGDIILTPEERLNIYKKDNSFGASKLKWPGKEIVYAFAPDIEKEIGAKQAIYSAINEYHKLTCLTFVKRTNQKAYIEFYNGQGCGAPLGYRNSKNRISLQGPSCWNKGTIIHEIMHSLGFYHEQSRPDRDQYVKILWENLSSKDMASNFQKQPFSKVNSMRSPYDYLSIMHYHKDGFAKRGKITIKTLDPAFQDKIGQRNDFSKQDLYQLNKLYKCGDTFSTQPPITSIYPVCKDKNENCDFYSRYCAVKSWSDFMRRECKFTCSFCDTTRISATPNTLTKPASSCTDELGATCLDYPRRGYCKSPSFKTYMKKNCKKSCGHC